MNTATYHDEYNVDYNGQADNEKGDDDNEDEVARAKTITNTKANGGKWIHNASTATTTTTTTTITTVAATHCRLVACFMWVVVQRHSTLAIHSLHAQDGAALLADLSLFYFHIIINYLN